MSSSAMAIALSEELTTCRPNEALTVSMPQTGLPAELSIVNCSSSAARSSACCSAVSIGVWIWKPSTAPPDTLAVCWICAFG